MSRQRRLDAIARRRAFIDNQLQLLTTSESRVPNIIRNRRSVKPQPRYPSVILKHMDNGASRGTNDIFKSHHHHPYLLSSSTSTSHEVISYQHDESSLREASDTFMQECAVEVDNISVPPMDFTGSGYVEDTLGTSMITDDDNSCQSSPTFVASETDTAVENTGDYNPINTGAHSQEGIVTITDSEMAQLLASSNATSFQTIQAEDGTVMVVLEGGEWGGEIQTTDTIESTSFSPKNVSNHANDTDETVEEDNVYPDDTNLTVAETDPLYRSDFEEASVKEEEEEASYIDNVEESYVILQTPEGDVLIPSSSLCTQSEIETSMPELTVATSSSTSLLPYSSPVASTKSSIKPQPPSSAGESIMQFVATEGAKIENLISKRKSVVLSAVASSTLKRSKVAVSSSSSTNSPYIVKPKSTLMEPGYSKLTSTTSKKSFQSQVPILKTKSSGVAEDVKPRPFRFELPELDTSINDLNNTFLCVPIVKIDSLRSETEKKGNISSPVDNGFSNAAKNSSSTVNGKSPVGFVHSKRPVKKVTGASCSIGTKKEFCIDYSPTCESSVSSQIDINMCYGEIANGGNISEKYLINVTGINASGIEEEATTKQMNGNQNLTVTNNLLTTPNGTILVDEENNCLAGKGIVSSHNVVSNKERESQGVNESKSSTEEKIQNNFRSIFKQMKQD